MVGEGGRKNKNKKERGEGGGGDATITFAELLLCYVR